MYRLANLIFICVIFSTSVNAALITYEFDTLRFENEQTVTGEFIYDTDRDALSNLSILLWGPELEVEFSLADLTSPDAFSISFDNFIFGDDDSEGFQLFKDDIFLATGLYGLGAEDTCYEDASFIQFCDAGLFSFEQSATNANAINEPAPFLLIFIGMLVGLSIRYRRR
ncbi:hypothetical protein AB6T38_18710 [Aliiglaciecola sp. SL4]|uniref:hypothetical protein n=1 Tax=Aliiglaciecola sp. SL4 TaxID=3239806 RepID=UPI00355AE648